MTATAAPDGGAAPTIRPFRRADQAAVEALIQDGMRERWGEAFDPAFNADVTDLWASYVEPGADVVVLEAGGVVVGTGTLLDLGAGVGRVVRMAVAGSCRRRGYGRAVVADLLDRARGRGMGHVVVLTDTPWPDAVAFYRSCGFEVELADDVDVWLAVEVAEPCPNG